MKVGEVAASTARDQDLLADPFGMIEQNNTAPALAGLDSTHQASRTGADYDHVELLLHCYRRSRNFDSSRSISK